jgi:hypothetical protein
MDVSDWLALPFTETRFRRFCSEYTLMVEDFRGKGGNVWVYDFSNRKELTRVLKNWGFRYKAEREAWWRQ